MGVTMHKAEEEFWIRIAQNCSNNYINCVNPCRGASPCAVLVWEYNKGLVS